jgi:putative component of membrane protein insertase Oxa1/YidC/SpoIIIJ protein YidD
MIYFYILIFCFNTVIGQNKYPSDSLLLSPNITFVKKIGLAPISAWQRISYNSDFFNCQFYPSCSNYGSDAIKQFGLLRGGVIIAERITRCNPFAFHYHLKQNNGFNDIDGRLIDSVIYLKSNNYEKSPFIAGLLSSIIPGLGRIYAGRTLDGVIGFWTFLLYSKTAHNSVKYKQKIATPVLTTISLYVYLGEIYGGWRTAKKFKSKKDDNNS